MDNPTTTQYANLMHNFILKARSTVREIDPQNDLTFLRIRSKKNEIMVAPGREYPCLCLNLWVARTLLPYSLALGKSSHCTSLLQLQCPGKISRAAVFQLRSLQLHAGTVTLYTTWDAQDKDYFLIVIQNPTE
nr:dynein light chain roadblock-type 1 isoform X2 [Cavia porcellus]XP_013005705.2 dynein light chain roadblock-type 1 isoform X2 [Cavia porcellus]XP_013005706.2 dynein light chain roadblock-type 1 isoform X2 [Cavia porcellus]XP_013005707.2 dynein light chain roadblock-type 1 isoform X2 [Cavia porcellus]